MHRIRGERLFARCPSCRCCCALLFCATSRVHIISLDHGTQIEGGRENRAITLHLRNERNVGSCESILGADDNVRLLRRILNKAGSPDPPASDEVMYRPRPSPSNTTTPSPSIWRTEPCHCPRTCKCPSDGRLTYHRDTDYDCTAIDGTLSTYCYAFFKKSLHVSVCQYS